MQTAILLSLLCILALSFESESKRDNDPVTCGSVVKLQHKETGNNLHSHGIAWGSGSGQQSVTTNSARNEKGSLWLIKEASHSPICEIGTPIRCGEVVRLEHADTKKNLHSHLFKAPLSGNQEVSGFGDGGAGDTGDNWVVECDSTNDPLWFRYKNVALKHVDTNKYLVTSAGAVFNQQNCGGNCPIMSQTEVSAAARKDGKAKWATDQGLYYPAKLSTAELDDEL